MTVEEFASATGLTDRVLVEGFEAFGEELSAPRKTLAARSADLAQALRQVGADEDAVYAAVCLLAKVRRR
ncbi:hypothetical protein [Nocardia sp. NPDC004260]